MKAYTSLTPELSEWALKQPVFFVGTAPTYGKHVNVSPKGLPSTSLAFLTPNRVAYVDRTGSGCETIAHLQENGRATFMFMSFGAAPRILRLYCRRTEVVEWVANEARFMSWLGQMGLGGGGGRAEGARAIIVLDVFKVTTACGYAVPMVRRDLLAAGAGLGGGDDDDGAGNRDPELAVFEDRHTLDAWAAKKEKDCSILDYRADNNTESLDGLPGLRTARRHAGHWLLLGDLRAWSRRLVSQGEGFVAGILFALLLGGLVLQLQKQTPAEKPST